MSRDGSASRLHHIRGRSHASFGPFCDIALCLLQKVRSRVISRLHMLAASCCLPDRCCRTRDFVGISEQHRFKITNKRATLIQIAIRLDFFVSNFEFTFLLRILFRQCRSGAELAKRPTSPCAAHPAVIDLLPSAIGTNRRNPRVQQRHNVCTFTLPHRDR